MSENFRIVPRYRVANFNNVVDSKKKKNTKKTTVEYKEELKIKNPSIEVLDEYDGAKTKILHKCLICKHIWSSAPSNILAGKYCPSCANKNRNKNKQPSQDEYISMLATKNETLNVVGLYVNMKTKIEHLCLLCNKNILITPEHALRGYGCKSCSAKINGQKLQLTHEQFKENVYSKNKNIELLTDYVGSSSPITCRCKICENIWTVKYPFQLYNSNCPNCVAKIKGKKLQNTIDEFKDMIVPNVTLLSDYQGANKKIDCLCNICNFKWTVNQAGSLKRSGCPNCIKSHGELQIEIILKNKNIIYKHQKKFKGLFGVGGGLLSYDFYLPQYNLLIEFQGKQHEQPIKYFGGEDQFKMQQEHDKRKREYAKQNNINLLEIWYYDIDNIESILLQKINETKNNLKLESLETAISA